MVDGKNYVIIKEINATTNTLNDYLYEIYPKTVDPTSIAAQYGNEYSPVAPVATVGSIESCRTAMANYSKLNEKKYEDSSIKLLAATLCPDNDPACIQIIKNDFIDCNEPLASNEEVAECMKAQLPDKAELITPELIAQARQSGRDTVGVTNQSYTESNGSTCGSTINSVGWIICPMLDTASGFADMLWGFFEALLVFNPILDTNGSVNEYISKTWSGFRGIANSILVIILLIIVFSQISGFGIDNYGVKKMLPRLIAIAVAVNLSLIIMQISVDLANILGKSLDELMSTAGNTASLSTISESGGWGALITMALSGGAVAGIGVLAGFVVGPQAVLIFIALLMIPVIISFIAGLATLIVRSALIPIVVIISPLALTAYILPNTQELFNKWKKLFTSVVFMYPLASIYYGALKLAAVTMAGVGGWLGILMSLFTLYFGTGFVLFLALKSNAILGKVTGAVQGALNKAMSPVESFGRGVAGSMAKEGLARRVSTRNPRRFDLVTRGMQRFDRGKRARATRTAAYNQEAKRAYEDQLINDPSLLGDAAGTRGGQAYLASLGEQQVKEAESTISAASIDQLGNVLRNAIANNDKVTAQAAQNTLLSRGSAGIEKFSSTIGEYPAGTEIGQVLASNLAAKHGAVMGQDVGLKQWAVEGGGVSIGDARMAAYDQIIQSGTSTDKFASLTEKEQLRIIERGGKNLFTDEQINALLDPNSASGSKITKSVKDELSDTNKKLIV